MALVNCAECGNLISDTAKFCPHCGFVAPKVKRKVKTEKINIRKVSHDIVDFFVNNSVMNKIYEVLWYIFSFSWIEDFADLFEDIPVIGGFLSGLVKIATCIATIGAIIIGGYTLIAYLYEVTPNLTILLGVIAFNVFNYFAATDRLRRNGWFFFIGLIFSTPFFIGSLCGAF